MWLTGLPQDDLDFWGGIKAYLNMSQCPSYNQTSSLMQFMALNVHKLAWTSDCLMLNQWNQFHNIFKRNKVLTSKRNQKKPVVKNSKCQVKMILKRNQWMTMIE